MNDVLVNSITCSHDWNRLREDAEVVRVLETEILPPYANTCRWFAGKARQQAGFAISAVHEIPLKDAVAYLLILEARYEDGDPEQYQLPFSFLTTAEADAQQIPEKGRIARACFNDTRGLLVDALYDERFRQALFTLVANQQEVPQSQGQLTFHRGLGLAAEDQSGPMTSRVLPVDSSNSALVFGRPGQPETYFMKLYRKLFRETNPEVDMVSFLTDHSQYTSIPAYAGSFSWQQPNSADITLGMMQEVVENQNDSWAQTSDFLDEFLQAVPQGLFAIREEVFDRVALLGQRTAEMHLALYKPGSESAFRPEPFTGDYRQFIIQRVWNLLQRRYALLADNLPKLDPQAQVLAQRFMDAKPMLDEFIADFGSRPIDSLRIRIHGDYHLGQVLATAADYIIIDFEGEPESSIADRKIKHSPLKDIAGMIRSYHYAISAKLFTSSELAAVDPGRLQAVSDRWFKLMRDTYLDAYLNTIGHGHPLLYNSTEVNYLLLIYLLEKAVYELGYEISYRPTWVKIPLKGIDDVIREIEKLQS